MGCLADLWEILLETLGEYIFFVIKKNVKNQFLRVILYIVTCLLILVILLTPILLGYAVIAWILEGISNLIG